ncbi:unnamed protein product [Cylicocyclus nassatus]|uniref:RING-type E3 ubiquitin transferase n=1 Tax=Cylicocyclus nassatus TaxID=53992 RepID=A0AA36GSW8_CYLNA|nr:unnamed protein product [Cylicocyclus nassatus]
MQSYVAEVGEIIRAYRRDEEEIDALQERISLVFRELLGQRLWMRSYPYLQTLAKTTYYSCTTLAGVQTLGEEYVKLFGLQSDRRVPNIAARFVFVFLHAIAPLLSQLALQRAERLLTHPSTSHFLGIPLRHNEKARRSFLSLINWLRSIGVPQLHRIHVAFFYIFGIYYNLSRRVAGIRYQSLSPQTDVKALKVYKVLGYLTIAQTALSLTLWLASVMNESVNKTRNRKPHETSLKETDPTETDDDFPHAWFRCSVCLEQRSPSSTSCGHLFCWKCIQEHALSADDQARCPHCRAPIEASQVVPLLNL